MADDTNNMALPTLYLPRDVNQTLRSAAIRGSRSKCNLIRELIKTGLEAKRKEASSYLVEPLSNKQPIERSRREIVEGGAWLPSVSAEIRSFALL